MDKYVKIVKYMSGESIEEQLTELFENNAIDEQTRLFFAKNNCITTKDIAEVMTYFNIKKDSDFDDENVVFVPNKYCLTMQEEYKKKNLTKK